MLYAGLACLSVSTRLLNFETITSTQAFVILSPAKLMCDGHLLHLELKSALKLLHLRYRTIAPDRSITNHRSFSNEVLRTEEYAGNIKP